MAGGPIRGALLSGALARGEVNRQARPKLQHPVLWRRVAVYREGPAGSGWGRV